MDISLSLQGKIDRLTPAFPVGFAVMHHDAYRNMACEYVTPFDVADSVYSAQEGARPWVNLSSVAAGEDQADQVNTWRRSNFRRLQEDYPNVWTLISYSNVDCLGAYVDHLSDDLISTLVGLAHDYPVYDESDVSELEEAEIHASWDQYLCSDISRHYGLSEAEAEMWVEFSSATPNKVLDAFRSALDLMEYRPEHNSIDVLWSEEHVAMAARLTLATLNDDPTTVETLLATLPV